MTTVPRRSARRLDTVLPDGEWLDELQRFGDGVLRPDEPTWYCDEQPETEPTIGYLYDEASRSWLVTLLG